jgi:hypothetical protein
MSSPAPVGCRGVGQLTGLALSFDVRHCYNGSLVQLLFRRCTRPPGAPQSSRCTCRSWSMSLGKSRLFLSFSSPCLPSSRPRRPLPYVAAPANLARRPPVCPYKPRGGPPAASSYLGAGPAPKPVQTHGRSAGLPAARPCPGHLVARFDGVDQGFFEGAGRWSGSRTMLSEGVTLSGNERIITRLAFSPDGKTPGSCDLDTCWNLSAPGRAAQERVIFLDRRTQGVTRGGAAVIP